MGSIVEAICVEPWCPDGQCRDEGQICKGTCVKVGLAGDPCASESDCASAYSCDTTTGKCVEGSSEGGPCTSSSNCWDHTFCDVPSGQSTGMCAALKADGQPCNGNDECTSDKCSSAGICETPAVCI